MGITKAADFLPGGVTAVAPNGNVFYLADIAHEHLKLRQLRKISWTGYNTTGTVIGQMPFPAGTLTLPIVNSFYSKTFKKAFIEVDSPDGKYTLRADLTAANFDLSPLNTLPTAEAVKNTAVNKSDEANYAHDLEGKGLFSPERIMFSIFGMNWKRNAGIAAAVGIGLYFVTKRK